MAVEFSFNIPVMPDAERFAFRGTGFRRNKDGMLIDPLREHNPLDNRIVLNGPAEKTVLIAKQIAEARKLNQPPTPNSNLLAKRSGTIVGR